LYILGFLLLAGYLVYSQTFAFHWDEGFHLLTATLINQGKKPYIDFCFPQAPLNAYWNAAWMRVFGPSWRALHAIAALLVIGAMLLIVRWLRDHFPDQEWRAPAALCGMIFFGLNLQVIQYGPISQAYAFSMFTMTVAGLAAFASLESKRALPAFLAGLFAGAAVCSTMLAAAAGPVFLIWILVYTDRGRRLSRFFAFASGAILAFAPIEWLFAKGFRQTWFNLVEYHAVYRRVDWPGAGPHDFDILTSWIDETQGFIFALLAMGAILFLFKSKWTRKQRAPFYLCAWIIAATGVQDGLAHPTFPQYFMPMFPAFAILAVAGWYALTRRLEITSRPLEPLCTLVFLFAILTTRTLFDSRTDFTWRKLERAAAKVEEVTPPNAALLAAEPIYFLTHRPAPEGMEFDFGHKLDFGAQRNALLHILPQKELQRRISAKMYPTDAVCDDSDEVDRINGLNLYANKADLGECTVFWGFK